MYKTDRLNNVSRKLKTVKNKIQSINAFNRTIKTQVKPIDQKINREQPTISDEESQRTPRQVSTADFKSIVPNKEEDIEEDIDQELIDNLSNSSSSLSIPDSLFLSETSSENQLLNISKSSSSISIISSISLTSSENTSEYFNNYKKNKLHKNESYNHKPFQ